jgi:NitT/TauT family transport system substrate-binding protein
MKNTGIAGFMAALFFVTAQSSAAQPKPESVKAMYSTLGGSQAVLWIAKEAGFFKENGLDVEPIYVSGGPSNVAALLSGEASFSQNAGPPVLGADLKGADIVFVVGLVNELPYVLISSKDIKRAEDLRGKKVGISRFGASSEKVARLALKKLGIDDKKDVTLMQIGGVMERFASLQSGMIQATVAELPIPRGLSGTGYNLLLDLTGAAILYQHTGLTVRRQLIESKPDTVRHMVKAYVEAINFFKTQKKASAVILGKYLRTADQEFLNDMVEFFAERTPTVPYPTIAGLKTALELFYPQSVGSVNPGDFADLRFIRELEESAFIEKLYR